MWNYVNRERIRNVYEHVHPQSHKIHFKPSLHVYNLCLEEVRQRTSCNKPHQWRETMGTVTAVTTSQLKRDTQIFTIFRFLNMKLTHNGRILSVNQHI